MEYAKISYKAADFLASSDKFPDTKAIHYFLRKDEWTSKPKNKEEYLIMKHYEFIKEWLSLHQTHVISNEALNKIRVIIGLLFANCSVKNTDFQIISTERVTEKYSYNPMGFIESDYGKLNIKTISYYDKEGKLKKVLYNRANGFLEYTLSELKSDSALLNSLQVDTLFTDKKYISYIKEEKNDTIFYLSGDTIVMKTP